MNARYFISNDYINPKNIFPYKDETIDKLKKKHLNISIFHSNFYMIKYDKKFKHKLDSTARLFRSVIFKNNKCVCFSPPKSLSLTTFKTKHKYFNDVKVEKFIDGTMINLFYDENMNWQICTRSTLGGNTKYGTDITFREMFIEAAKNCNLNLDYLDIRFCYSFILQHPKNRIVSLVNNPLIYLIAVYEITNNSRGTCIEELDIHKSLGLIHNNDNNNNNNNNNSINMNKYFGSYLVADYNFKDTYINELLDAVNRGIKVAPLINKTLYKLKNYRLLDRKYSDKHINNNFYSDMGVVLKCGNDRTKIRNMTYEYVKMLKGNENTILARYLRLKSSYQIKEYLKYYPEHKYTFDEFFISLKNISSNIFKIYHKYFLVKLLNKQTPNKTNPVDLQSNGEYPDEYNIHLITIRKQYMKDRKNITMKKVIEYVNNLHKSSIMHIFNKNKGHIMEITS